MNLSASADEGALPMLQAVAHDAVSRSQDQCREEVQPVMTTKLQDLFEEVNIADPDSNRMQGKPCWTCKGRWRM